MVEAEIGAKLIEKDQTLLLAENKDKLLTEIQSIYHRDHAVRVTLDPQQTALVDMLAAITPKRRAEPSVGVANVRGKRKYLIKSPGSGAGLVIKRNPQATQRQ